MRAKRADDTRRVILNQNRALFRYFGSIKNFEKMAAKNFEIFDFLAIFQIFDVVGPPKNRGFWPNYFLPKNARETKWYSFEPEF